MCVTPHTICAVELMITFLSDHADIQFLPEKKKTHWGELIFLGHLIASVFRVVEYGHSKHSEPFGNALVNTLALWRQLLHRPASLTLSLENRGGNL